MNKKNLMLFAISANFFEWYEYIVFAFLGKYIGFLFFDSQGEKEAVLFTFMALAAGYLARPIGALYFGAISDRKGTSKPIYQAMVLMAIPTFLVLICPLYKDAGVISSILLVTFRLTQGFAAGAELPLMAVHTYGLSEINIKKRSCAFVNASSLLGVLVASLVLCICNRIYTEEEMLNGAWRYPFIIGIPILVIIFFLRKKVLTDQVIRKQQREDIKNALKKNAVSLIDGFVVVGALQVSFYIMFIWYADYLRVFLGVSEEVSMAIRFLSLGILFLVVLISGAFLDRFNNSVLLRNIFVAVIFFVPGVFYMAKESSTLPVLILGVAIVSLPVGCLNSMIFSYLNELFDQSFRGFGVSCSFTLASVFVGGFSPVLAMKMIESTGDCMAPAYLVSTVYGISAIFIFSVRRRLLFLPDHR